jgi:hypothetical protein
MNEKSITFTILAVVAIVAVAGFVVSMTSQNTGLVYGRGGTSYGYAISSAGRGFAAGETSAVTNTQTEGTIITTGYPPLHSQKKTVDKRPFELESACTPLDEDGNPMKDPAHNTVITGTLKPDYSIKGSSIWAKVCTKSFVLLEQGANQENQLYYEAAFECCWPPTTSGVESTGVAYYYQYHK